MNRHETAWTAWVLTLFPDMFPGPLGFSLAGRGLEQEVWRLRTMDLRDFAQDKHRLVDGAPVGGGPGMVMRADVVAAAIDAARRDAAAAFHVDEEAVPLLYMSPRGARMDQAMANELAAQKGVIVLCGRFEGVDERVLASRQVREVSVGDLVLSGGEPAAMTLLDATVRLLPGIVGAPESLAEESFSNGLLEYPQFTRPMDWEGQKVPEILTSGHHGNIRAWRLAEAERITKQRRADLWSRYQAGRHNGQSGNGRLADR